jgi:hypothetical protein
MKQTGRSKHQLYNRWYSMIGRCKYPSHTSYKWYGARGVKVCDRWLVFENWLSDMGPIPFPEATIERKDGGKNYSPDNCCWASQSEQAQNKQSALRIEFNGQTLTARQWSVEVGIPYGVIVDRIYRKWSPERALTTPVKTDKLLEFAGASLTHREWSQKTGLKVATIWHRLSKGWGVERALTEPLRVNQFQ